MSLSATEFSEFRRFLKQAAGIDLSDNKQYLVTTRIRKILLDSKMDTLGQLLKKIDQPGERKLRQMVVDAMTTNETFWFRDKYPFEYLKSTIFPELQKKNTLSIPKIWCSACSSGQEPYSISMIAEEYQQEVSSIKNFNVDIVATDLSSAILNHARQGVYDKLSISRGMSDERLRKFFKENNNSWELNASVRKRVRFKPVNLQEKFVGLNALDVVFCRNVLIYFSSDLKDDILKRIHATLKPGGYLFLGSSESLGGASHLYNIVHTNPGVVYVARAC